MGCLPHDSQITGVPSAGVLWGGRRVRFPGIFSTFSRAIETQGGAYTRECIPSLGRCFQSRDNVNLTSAVRGSAMGKKVSRTCS